MERIDVVLVTVLMTVPSVLLLSNVYDQWVQRKHSNDEEKRREVESLIKHVKSMTVAKPVQSVAVPQAKRRGKAVAV